MSAAVASNCYAVSSGDNCNRPFYVGMLAGYGATTWQGLVPEEDNQNLAMCLSTPVNVNEGGVLWGLYAGYEFMPCFALEASWMRYPNATINFDAESLFAFDNDGIVNLNSHTESAALMAKFMVVVPTTKIRAYSSAGIAAVHRKDVITDTYHGAPAFGLGLNYNLTEHLMVELSGMYTAGYAESEIEPVNDYVPFLYSGFFRIGYRL